MQLQLGKQPTAQQQKFIDCSAREQLFGGAKRGGKSVSLCQKGILLSVLFPGNRGLLARKDFTDLWDTTLNEFFQVCPADLIVSHNKGERCIRLKTANPKITSDIIYRGLGDANDFEKAKSLTLGWFGIDEPSEINVDVYKQLRSQLNWVLPTGKRPPYMALLASNPEPGWVKQRFIDSVTEGCAFIPALPRDNPHLPPGWEDELRSTYDIEWIEKYLDGSWEVHEGAVFPELDGRIHIIDPPNTAGLKLVGAIDHGTTGTTAFVIVGIDADNNIIALHEHYGQGKLISQNAAAIKDIVDLYIDPKAPTALGRKLDYLLIDPACTGRTQQGANQLQSVADQYREQGLMVVPAWNALEAGLQRIKEYLHVKPNHIHPISGKIGSPSLLIVKRFCPNLWKEMKDIKKEILPSGLMRFVGLDHALDCLRYIVNSRPRVEQTTTNDLARMPNQVRFAMKTHDKWASKWDKRSAGKSSGTWFSNARA
jgi:hypothetical protein